MTDPNPEAIVAANARRLREARGWTQAAAARLITESGYEMGEMALWGLENSRRRIKVADLFGLAAAFEVTPESLLSPDSDSDQPQSTQYEVTVAGGLVRTVTADDTGIGDGFLNFYLRGARVFFAPVAGVLCVQIAAQRRTVASNDGNAGGAHA